MNVFIKVWDIFNLVLQLWYAAPALLACKSAVTRWESWGVFLLIVWKVLKILEIRENEEADIKLSASIYDTERNEKKRQEYEAMVGGLY